MKIQVLDVDGVRVELERRRYGRTTYTWAYARLNDDRVQLGDPWPCLTPPFAELLAAVQGAKRQHATV